MQVVIMHIRVNMSRK